MKKYTLNDFLTAQSIPAFILSKQFAFSNITSVDELGCGGVGCTYKVNYRDNNQIYTVCIKLQYHNPIFTKFTEVYSKYHTLFDNYISFAYEIGSLTIHNTPVDYIIMEYIPYVTLNHTVLNNKQVASLFLFLLQFMYTLHTNNMSYSDIKPENIIYTGNNNFKIIDIDTILPLISTSQDYIYNTTTKYFDITNTTAFTSHQLNQLVSCVYTCLDCMKLYPRCSSDPPVLEYCNYLINLANYYNITNANQIVMEEVFNQLLQYINSVTSNLLYSLLSLFMMYILLIPRYTIAYIDTIFWYNTFMYYYQYIPEISTTSVQLCNDQEIYNNMNIITAIGVEPWSDQTDPAVEASKIPQLINITPYKESLNNYIVQYSQTIQGLPVALQSKYRGYAQQDVYSLLRQDPRSTYRTPLYKRI